MQEDIIIKQEEERMMKEQVHAMVGNGSSIQ